MSNLTTSEKKAMWETVRLKRRKQISDLKNASLKSILKMLSLRTTGVKKDLVERLTMEMETVYILSSNLRADRQSRLTALDRLKILFTEVDKFLGPAKISAVPANKLASAAPAYASSYHAAIPLNTAPTTTTTYTSAPRTAPPQNNAAIIELGRTSHQLVTSAPTHPDPSFAPSLLPLGPLPSPLLAPPKPGNCRHISARLGQYGLTTLPYTVDPHNSPFGNETRLSTDYYRTFQRFSRVDPSLKLLFPKGPQSTRPLVFHTFSSQPVRSSFHCPKMMREEHPVTAGHMLFTLPPQTQYLALPPQTPPLPWIQKHYQVILRALPLTKPANKADVHTWPKDVEVFVNNVESRNIKQRKQASHDRSLWKGHCYPLDITSSLYPNDLPNSVTVLSKDPELYVFELALLEKVPTDVVVSSFLEKAAHRTLSAQESQVRATKYVQDQTISLDEDPEMEQEITTTFLSLNDPTSMQLIDVPVRGNACKHVQCFDLKYFMEMNAFPSVRRWLCPCCEKVLEPDSLVKDLLIQLFLDKFKGEGVGEVGEDGEEEKKTRVAFKSDSTWDLRVPATRKSLSNKKRKRALSPTREEAGGGAPAGGGGESSSSGRVDAPIEIIEID